ncbi:MAG: hypothetical protein HFJ38_01220 [Bacilli bacterium]|nr:hypothetical protein [Bacilli bacterium]
MEEIDLKELFEFIKVKIYVIIFVIGIVLIIGGIYTFQLKVPVYQSSATIVLANNEQANSTEITQNEVALNQKLVSTYSEIVKSRKVLTSVIDSMNLNYSYEELSKEVSVHAVENTEIIKITVTDRDSLKAQKIAKNISNVFAEEVSSIYKVKNVHILDTANYSKKPSNINYIKELCIYIVSGFVIGFGILFIIFYVDNTIKTVEQVEAKLGLPILGRIPLYNSKKSNKRGK